MMTSDDFAQKIKTKYPQYANLSNEDLTQRMIKKYPQYASQVQTNPSPDFKTSLKNVVSKSAQDIFKKPFAYAKNLGTNPEAMASAMPALMGTVGAFSSVPGGATAGTAIGDIIRDLALKGIKKPIPSLAQHGLELGGAAIGDIAAIPFAKKAYYGPKIGAAERAAGVITRAPTKAVTPGSVGETLGNLEAQLDAGTIHTPQEARDAKAVISQIYKNKRIYEQTPEINVQAARVSRKVQDLLNKLVPGRLAPSEAMGKALTIPNAIKDVYTGLPWPIRRGAEAALGWETIRKLLGV